MAVKAVFLDKDGTLLQNVPYNTDPDRMRFAPDAGRALRRLHALGYVLIVVSNQPGVALGLFQVEALHAVERRLREMFADQDVPLAGFYFCPHHPEGRITRYTVACRCRKPAPGLILSAATIHDVAPHRSWMIGDILDDIEAGTRARCRTIMLDVGNETEWRSGSHRKPGAVVASLSEAAARIAQAERGLGLDNRRSLRL